VEHRDEIEERGDEPEARDQWHERSAREHNGDRSVREEPALGFPGEKHDERRVHRERGNAGNEIRTHAAKRQDAVGRRKIPAREQARGNAAPHEDEASEVDDDHRPLGRLPSVHGQNLRRTTFVAMITLGASGCT
jgi:hypothetical protein